MNVKGGGKPGRWERETPGFQEESLAPSVAQSVRAPTWADLGNTFPLRGEDVAEQSLGCPLGSEVSRVGSPLRPGEQLSASKGQGKSASPQRAVRNGPETGQRDLRDSRGLQQAGAVCVSVVLVLY